MWQAVYRTGVVPEVEVVQSARRRVGHRAVHLLDVVGEHALGPRHQFILHARTLFQRAKAIHLDGREVREDITPALIGLDEAKPFGIVEPFDNSCGQKSALLLICSHF